MVTKLVIFTLFFVRFMFTSIFILSVNSCASISIYTDLEYWTHLQTEVTDKQTLFINFPIPPGAKIINVPPRAISHPKKLESLLLSANYFYVDKIFADVYLTVVLYNVTKYGGINLIKLSRKLYADHNIVSHNKSSAWFKNQGEITQLENKSVLFRRGYSTGPNEDQKLNNQVEDAYLLQLNAQYVLGVYAHRYADNAETKNFVRTMPKILENISVRIL